MVEVFFCILAECNDIVSIDDRVLPLLFVNDEVDCSLKIAQRIASAEGYALEANTTVMRRKRVRAFDTSSISICQ